MGAGIVSFSIPIYRKLSTFEFMGGNYERQKISTFYLYKYYSGTLHHGAIAVLQLENGVKREFHETLSTRTYVEDVQDYLDAVEHPGTLLPVPVVLRWGDLHGHRALL